MECRKLGNSNIEVTTLALGTWAFGGDRWWGKQEDLASQKTLYRAIELGINFIDTAPIYGNGHSETVIGEALKKQRLRDKVILATKVGLRWKGKRSFHNLRRKSILEEVEDSLKRLQTEVLDLYQVHFPDPSTPIGETAQALYKLYQEGKIKTIGVSNYSVDQMQEFMKFSPLHSLQPRYNMFRRKIENETLPFCIEHNISVIAYSPLNNGILTGKFFFGEKIPQDKVRSINFDLQGENFAINKEIIIRLKEIASKYKKSLTQLALNWIIAKKGLTCAIVGARRPAQIEENTGSVGWEIAKEDMETIEAILREREKGIDKVMFSKFIFRPKVCIQIGLFANIALTIFKFFAGILGFSKAMVADALHSFSDILTTVVAYIGICIGARPADTQHPYGHGNAETIAASIMSIIILAVGVWAGFSAVSAIIHRQFQAPLNIALLAAVISILIKEALFRYTVKVGKISNNPVVVADAWHHRSDAYSSIAALIGIAGAKISFLYLDPLAGIVVSILIVKIAFRLMRQNIGIIMDEKPHSAFINNIRKVAQKTEGVKRVDTVKVHRRGSNFTIDLEIAVERNITVDAGHRIAANVKKKLLENIKNIHDVMVHVNPL